MPDKKIVRQEYREKRDHLPEPVRRTENERIFQAICKMPLYQKCGRLFTYYSVGSEVDTHRIIEQAFADGKRVFLPLCEANHRMRIYEIRHPHDILPGAYQIPVPADCRKPLAPEKADLSLVPGLCFDRLGYRLGYGGGYYDRFLPGIQKGTAVGLCYHAMLVSAVPRNFNDQKCDFVVTGNGVIRT